MNRVVKAALCQYEIGADWDENMAAVEDLLGKSSGAGADMAILPEMFMMPYDMNLIPEWAEPVPDGRTCLALGRLAQKYGLALVGGSIPEKAEDGRYFNTSTVWNASGEMIARHRKMHLFDVDLPGGVSVKESSVLSPGGQVTVCEVAGLKLGVAICYDVRFPELFRLMALRGVDFVALPGAFNNVSGPAHWELLLRNRAVENTFYVAGVSGISPKGSNYDAWGHSMVTGPFGEIVVDMGRSRGFAIAELDPDRIADIRSRLPVLSQRRTEIYELSEK